MSADDAMVRPCIELDLEADVDAESVIEPIVEDQTASLTLMKNLNSVMRNEPALIASNTSSIPIMRLGAGSNVRRSSSGMHFFNPVPVLPLVELVPSLLSSPDTTGAARGFVEDVLGKTVVESRNRAGFIVNALLIPFVLSGHSDGRAGVATAEDVHRALVTGAAHPQGPPALADLIGLDTTRAVATSLYKEFKEPLYAATTAVVPARRRRTARPKVRPRFLRLRHLTPPAPSALASRLPQGVSLISAFVYASARTPFGRFGGGLTAIRPDDLASSVISAVAGRCPGLRLSELMRSCGGCERRW